jgi:AGCS family alanine or glycine:cation symporter
MFFGDIMIDVLNKLLWAVATSLILFSSIYFTFSLKFIQFNLKAMISNLMKKEKHKDSISPFKTLMLALAGRIGVGSIAGVALAIYLGGLGSIFWMWIIGILSAVNTFAETALGIVYKKKDSGNIYKGGPSYYIKEGLKKPTLGNLYAIFIILSYIGGFISIQSNTITKSLGKIIEIDPIIIGIIISLLTAAIIFGGIKKIANFTSKLVPLMTLFYLSVALYVIVTNVGIIPNIFYKIIVDAFNFESFTAGFLPIFIIGIQRGIFSNEAGLGTGSIASSTTDENNPTGQGYVQMLGIYITTLLICTATAIIILTSNYSELILEDVNGIEITQHAFNYHIGQFGSIALFTSILFFSFSTILTGYYYGESSLKYFFNKINNRYLIILKIVTLISLFIGSIISSSFLWKLVDMLVAILAIINIYALLNLRKEVKSELDCYNNKKCDKM